MIVSMIVAMDHARGIGRDGRVPWHLSADLKHFKEVTMGHTLIQGRVTWESIGRPLPGRRMVVVTRQRDYEVPEGVAVCGSLGEALALAEAAGDDETFIGGGAALYAEGLRICDRIYLTRVDAEVEADTVFPRFDEGEWRASLVFAHPADERNEYDFRVELLERRNL